jgi:hypothetical protein
LTENNVKFCYRFFTKSKKGKKETMFLASSELKRIRATKKLEKSQNNAKKKIKKKNCSEPIKFQP